MARLLLLCYWIVPVLANEGRSGSSENATFERYFGYRLSENVSQEFVLRNFSMENGTGLVRSCRRACLDRVILEEERCRGFNVHLQEANCVTYGSFYESDAKFLRMQLQHYEGSTFWRRTLVKTPLDCLYLWQYDALPGLAVRGDKVDRFVPVSSMDQCAEACSDERAFQCRAATYNYVTRNCHLSRHDRRSLASYFVQGGAQEVYLENQCANSAMSGCEFVTEESAAPSFSLDSAPADNSAQCEKLCLHNPEFACRSFTYSPEKGLCSMGPEDAFSMANGTTGLQRVAHFQRYDCTNVRVSCGSNQITASFRADRAFDGRIVSLSAPKTCTFDVKQQLEFNISLSMEQKSNCGIIDEESNVVSAMVMMQYHDSVITGKDRAFKLVCQYELGNKTVSNFVELGEGDGASNATVVSGGGPLPEAFMRIVNGEGRTVTTAEIGQTLYAEVILKEQPGAAEGLPEHGLFVNNCEALDEGRNVLLLDKAGCPTDPALFEGFHPVQGGNYKALRAAFQGFRFQTKKRVTINCNVNFCFRFCQGALCTDKNGRRIMSLGRKRRDSSVVNSLEWTLEDQSGGARVQSGFDVVDYRKVPVIEDSEQFGENFIVKSSNGLEAKRPSTVRDQQLSADFDWPVIFGTVIVGVLIVIALLSYYLRKRDFVITARGNYRGHL